MPKPESAPDFLFLAQHAPYYAITYGCLRFVRVLVDGKTLVGTRFGKTYHVPLDEADPQWNLK